jgi:hypothetical protein
LYFKALQRNRETVQGFPLYWGGYYEASALKMLQCDGK